MRFSFAESTVVIATDDSSLVRFEAVVPVTTTSSSETPALSVAEADDWAKAGTLAQPAIPKAIQDNLLGFLLVMSHPPLVNNENSLLCRVRTGRSPQ